MAAVSNMVFIRYDHTRSVRVPCATAIASRSRFQSVAPSTVQSAPRMNCRGACFTTRRISDSRSAFGRNLMPYGEELTPTLQGQTKFATYFRDATGMDYADQRYYSPGTGRFVTA